MGAASLNNRQAGGAKFVAIIGLFSILVVLVCVAELSEAKTPRPRPMPGGIGEEKPADSRIRKIVRDVEGKFTKRTGYKIIKVISYRVQIVSGVMYHVKVKVQRRGSKSRAMLGELRIGERPWENFLDVVGYDIPIASRQSEAGQSDRTAREDSEGDADEEDDDQDSDS